jgi:hypothetical protein
VTFTLDPLVSFDSSLAYEVGIEYEAASGANWVRVGLDSTTPTHDGNYARRDSGVWSAQAQDMVFKINVASSLEVRALVEEYDESEFSELVLAGDLRLLVAALNVPKPDTGDTFTVDSIDYEVLGVDYLAAGTTPAAYEIQVRR